MINFHTKTKNLSQLSLSEADTGDTICGKTAPKGLLKGEGRNEVFYSEFFELGETFLLLYPQFHESMA
jgi:hypothetical protein